MGSAVLGTTNTGDVPAASPKSKPALACPHRTCVSTTLDRVASMCSMAADTAGRQPGAQAGHLHTHRRL